MLPSIVASSRQPCISRERHTRRFASRVGTKETSQEKDVGVQYARHGRTKLATQQPPSLPQNLLGHFEDGGDICDAITSGIHIDSGR